jgi:hypothetical protein
MGAFQYGDRNLPRRFRPESAIDPCRFRSNEIEEEAMKLMYFARHL